MTKARQLFICNWSLLIVTLFTLASSIQLEATGSAGKIPIWIHVIVSVIFISLICLHISLHFRWHNWFSKFSKLKSLPTKILWWLFLITLLSGIIAFIEWNIHSQHTLFGAVHGKIGFLMIALAICHAVKRNKFYYKPRK